MAEPVTFDLNLDYWPEANDSAPSGSPSTDISAYWQYRAQLYIFLYVSPILIIGGTIGNLLILWVMQSAAFRSAASGFILSVLAVSDTGILMTGLLRHWIKVLSDETVDVRTTSDLSCKFHFFFTYFLKQLSPWFLVLLTMERTMSVFYPMRCHRLCSKKRMMSSVFVVILLLIGLNLHCFRTIHLECHGHTEGNETMSNCSCKGKTEHTTFLFGPWYWIDSVVTSFLPFLIILIGNISIISKLSSAKLRRDKMTRSVNNADASKLTSTTLMLITVSMSFLLLTLPSCVFFIGKSYGAFPSTTKLDTAKLLLAYAFENMLFYLNNAINFFLYCLSGSKFRHVFISMITCCEGQIRSERSTNMTHIEIKNSV